MLKGVYQTAIFHFCLPSAGFNFKVEIVILPGMINLKAL